MEEEETATPNIPTRGEILRKKGRIYLLISIVLVAVDLLWYGPLGLAGMIGSLLSVSFLVFLILGVVALIKARAGG